MKKNTILITGASGKVGSAILEDLCKKNFYVIATYNKNKITIKKNNLIVKKFDQSKEMQVLNLIKFINKNKLNLVGLVNCSVLRPMKKGSKDSFKNWTKSILINANSTYLINKKFGEYFVKKNSEE